MNGPVLSAQPTQFRETPSGAVAATPTCCCCCCCLGTLIGGSVALGTIAHGAARDARVSVLDRKGAVALCALAPLGGVLAAIGAARAVTTPGAGMVMVLAAFLVLWSAGFTVARGWNARWAARGIGAVVVFVGLMAVELVWGLVLIMASRGALYLLVLPSYVWAVARWGRRVEESARSGRR